MEWLELTPIKTSAGYGQIETDVQEAIESELAINCSWKVFAQCQFVAYIE